jgi:hypothetical protein
MSLKQLERYALSDDDIQSILAPHKTKIWNYPELATVSNVNELFDDLGRCVILFDTISPYSGHWTGIIKRENEIEFFDPYGIKYDEEKKWISKAKLKAFHESEPLLTNLLNQGKQLGYKITWNTVKFQKDGEGINTCGRWTAVRLLFRDLSPKQFQRMIDASQLTPDEFVTQFTNEIIHK